MFGNIAPRGYPALHHYPDSVLIRFGRTVQRLLPEFHPLSDFYLFQIAFAPGERQHWLRRLTIFRQRHAPTPVQPHLPSLWSPIRAESIKCAAYNVRYATFRIL